MLCQDIQLTCCLVLVTGVDASFSWVSALSSDSQLCPSSVYLGIGKILKSLLFTLIWTWCLVTQISCPYWWYFPGLCYISLLWEINKSWLNYLLGLVSLLIALGPWASHFTSGGFKLPSYIMQESDWVPCKFFFFQQLTKKKKKPMKFVIFFSPWIGSYSRLLSSGVLLNLQTMINLHTSLACIPWRHLATRKEV